MFGHLKPGEFVNLMEGGELPAQHRLHIATCARCRATWQSLQSVHAEMTSMESDIPEPDWVHFRSSVRDQLLSRSVQRESAVRRWTGWAIRPAMAWALSVLFAVGLTTITVLWNIGSRTAAPTAVTESPSTEPAAEGIEGTADKTLFDDLVQLGDEQQEQLRQMLESAHRQ